MTNSSCQSRRAIGVGLCAWLLAGPVFANQPIDPQASADARAVLDYLVTLPIRRTNRFLSGQFICSAMVAPDQPQPKTDTQRCYDRFVRQLHEDAGRWMALVGADYGRLGDATPLDLSATNQPLIEHWRRGGLVTVTWHARNPWTDGDARDKTLPGPLTDLITDGTPVHETWMRELNRIADALAELQQAGVVVLWRPLHESNEHAFWWGTGQNEPADPEAVKQLWRHMVRYFEEERGLHNLLWVFSVTPQEKSGTAPELSTYPGSDAVDVVGFDVYADEPRLAAYDELAALGKPMGLTEFGPSVATAEARAYDYRRLLQQIKAHYPRLGFVQCWSDSSKSSKAWALALHPHARDFLRDPWVVTAEDVRWKPRRRWPWSR